MTCEYGGGCEYCLYVDECELEERKVNTMNRSSESGKRVSIDYETLYSIIYEKGMSLREVSRQLGRNHNHITSSMAVDVRLEVEIVDRLCEILGIEPERIVLE